MKKEDIKNIKLQTFTILHIEVSSYENLKEIGQAIFTEVYFICQLNIDNQFITVARSMC